MQLIKFSLRQHWLVFIFIVALHASAGVLANVPQSDFPLSEELNKTTVQHSGVEVLSPSQLVEVKLVALSSQKEELSTRIEMCQQELADALAKTNYSKTLEEKIERMERDYSQVLNETYAEIQNLEESSKQMKRNLKYKEERYQKERKKFLDVDAELRYMHAKSSEQYVNFTLMQEDLWNILENNFSNAKRRTAPVLRKLRPRMKEAKMRFNRWRRAANASLQPKMTTYRKNVQKLWSRSKIVRPFFERTWENIVENPALVEARVWVQLSVVSTIEEVSKALLTYLEKEAKMKQIELERERKMRDDPMRRRLEYKRRNRGAPEVANDRKFGSSEPSFLRLKVHEFSKSFFNYTLNKSEWLAERSVALFPLATALCVTQSGIVGIFLLCGGVPTPFVWMFAIVRFVTRLCRAKQGHVA